MITGWAKRSFSSLLLAASLSAATVDGIRLHSAVTGKGPRTIILVHGWTCDDRTWQSQVPELSGNYRVITLDLPGHGRSRSPKDGKLSMDLFARAIEAVRQEAKANRVVLVGHSMGTPVIMQYARLYPERTVALVLVEGSITLPQSAAGKLLAFARRYAESVETREAMVERMFSSATTPDVRKRVISMISSTPAPTAVSAMEAFVDSVYWKEDVFSQNTLGIYADGSLTAADRENMRTRFPNLECVDIPGAGHFLMLERPVEFNRILKSFLDKQKF